MREGDRKKRNLLIGYNRPAITVYSRMMWMKGGSERVRVRQSYSRK